MRELEPSPGYDRRNFLIVAGAAVLVSTLLLVALVNRPATVIGDAATSGESSGRLSTASPEPIDDAGTGATTEPCHYPTTVPGGTVPQPLCTDAEDITARTPGSTITDDTPSLAAFTCPAEDYPIVMVATTWASVADVPAALPACGGGDWELSDASILIPVAPLGGLDPNLSVGFELDRRPGGLDWTATVALPAVRRDRLVQLRAHTSMQPDAAAAIASSVRALCEDGEPRVVRGVEGCVVDGALVWADGRTRYELAGSALVEIGLVEIAAWLDTWRDLAP